MKRWIGQAFVVIGGIVGIGICALATNDQNSVIAIITIFLGLRALQGRKYPGVEGVLMGILFIALGSMAAYMDEPNILIAMLAVDYLPGAME